MVASLELFATVPRRDYLLFWQAGRFQPQRVARFLSLNKSELGALAGVAPSSVRFDAKIPRQLREYLSELAVTATLVAEMLEGDATRTQLWFQTPNPSLGDRSPMEMIEQGEHAALRRFVLEARGVAASHADVDEGKAPHSRVDGARTILEAQRAAIAELCKRFAVKQLAIFGSVLRQDFDTSRSDLDFTVEFASSSEHSPAKQYFDFKAALERLLGRPVDLVELSAMPDSRLKRSIERSKVSVYAEAA